MKQFNESFYTDDFDQEMLDFVQENYNVIDGGNLTIGNKYLKYGKINKYFWTHDNMPLVGFAYLTKNQFKEKIGMTKDKPLLENYFVKPNEMCEELPNTFTKSMLVSGEHVVKLKLGDYRMVLGDRLVNGSNYMKLKSMTDSLECRFDENLDVTEVYAIDQGFVLDELSVGKGIVLIWQRETPEQAQKRIRKQELEVTLREELKQAENELQEL